VRDAKKAYCRRSVASNGRLPKIKLQVTQIRGYSRVAGGIGYER
jgi:hypothetical protein